MVRKAKKVETRGRKPLFADMVKLEIKLDAKDKAKLQAAADKAGLTLSDFARRRLLG